MRPGPMLVTLFAVVAVLATGCGSDTDSEPADAELFPDVVVAEVEAQPDGTYRVSATLSSSYDTPDRYADAWRVTTPDGSVLGVRDLAHHHRDEQPFTRSLDGVEIPAGIEAVVVEGRDQVSGWGGGTITAPVPEPGN